MKIMRGKKKGRKKRSIGRRMVVVVEKHDSSWIRVKRQRNCVEREG